MVPGGTTLAVLLAVAVCLLWRRLSTAATGLYDIVRGLYYVSRMPGPNTNGLSGGVSGCMQPELLPVQHRAYQKWSDEHGPVVGLRIGYLPAVIVCDPRLMHSPDLFKLPRSHLCASGIAHLGPWAEKREGGQFATHPRALNPSLFRPADTVC